MNFAFRQASLRRAPRVTLPGLAAGLFQLVFLVSLIAFAVAWQVMQRFDSPGPLDEPRVVTIERGSGLNRIAADLAAAGVIETPHLFATMVRLMRGAAQLKAGEFAFAPAISMRQVMEKLIKGRVLNHLVTVPEGLTSLQIVRRLRADPRLSGTIADVPPEGGLLPDSYQIERGDARSTLLERMQAAHDDLVRTLWAARAPGLPLDSPQEMVILASLVEKEAGPAEEYAEIAGVFANRLRARMRLQSDPTILYGLYKGEAFAKKRGGITKSELAAPTDYNTYQIDGLPPGPIANPGAAALRAAANPRQTEAFYFVADGAGGHRFSRNYREHLQNVKKLRAAERARANDQK